MRIRRPARLPRNTLCLQSISEIAAPGRAGFVAAAA
jgi:hypothetical protein